jgi:hypothetical protein
VRRRSHSPGMCCARNLPLILGEQLTETVAAANVSASDT